MKTNTRELLLATLVVVVLCGGTWHVRAVASDGASRPRPPGFDEFIDSVRRGGLASVVATRPGDSPQHASEAVRSLEVMAQARGGVTMPESAMRRLEALERGYAAGEVESIDQQRLAAGLTDWILDDVLPTVTDADVNLAIDEARIPDSPELPNTFRAGRERLSVDAVSPTLLTTPTEARAAIARARQDGALRSAIRAEVERRIAGRLGERLDYLQVADPSRFRPDALSPVEVVTLLYSVAASDMLGRTQGELDREMEQLRAWVVDRHGTYPTWKGRKPFGPGGYLSAGATTVFVSRLEGLMTRLYAV